jgi:hypothetical protein
LKGKPVIFSAFVLSALMSKEIVFFSHVAILQHVLHVEKGKILFKIKKSFRVYNEYFFYTEIQ